MQTSPSGLSMVRTAKTLYKYEGFLRFYKGCNIVATGVIPAHAGQFAMYEFLKEKLDCKHQDYQIRNTMMIGACCTFTHDFFMVPSDVIK